MTTYHLTPVSSNRKTGPIPVSTTSSDTCPRTCGQFETCYAKQGPSRIHWSAVNSGSRGTDLAGFAAKIRALAPGTLWRHNQAGDLPGTDDQLDAVALEQLVKANSGRRGFTYTHKPMRARARTAIARANSNGFTINLSADTLAQADEYKALGIAPVVVVVPRDVEENFKTPAGNDVVICPAVTHDNVSCATCKLCAWRERDVIIAFPAHGAKAKSVKSDFVKVESIRVMGASN